jgi:osmotically-inducible protein OsmY
MHLCGAGTDGTAFAQSTAGFTFGGGSMRKLNPVLMAALCLTLVISFSACSNAGNRAGDRAAGNNNNQKLSNSDLEQRVKERFNSDPQLSTADLKINADADNNEVKLSGSVANEAERSKAVDLAKSAVPGATVTDTIDVKPREQGRADYNDQQGNNANPTRKDDKVGNSAEDQNIHSQILSNLNKAQVPVDKIKIEVEKGVVTLRGDVDSGEQKASAEKAVQGIDGVKQVNNELKVAGKSKGPK